MLRARDEKVKFGTEHRWKEEDAKVEEEREWIDEKVEVRIKVDEEGERALREEAAMPLVLFHNSFITISRLLHLRQTKPQTVQCQHPLVPLPPSLISMLHNSSSSRHRDASMEFMTHVCENPSC